MNTKSQDYHSRLEANVTPQAALDRISRVSEWWATNFEGSARNLGDVFTVRFGDVFVTFKVVEVAPGRKTVWLVTDCHLSWLKDKTEWKGTTIVWEVAPHNGATQIDMTHVGLVPEIECYDTCKVGWDQYSKQSLLKFLTDGKGRPDEF